MKPFAYALAVLAVLLLAPVAWAQGADEVTGTITSIQEADGIIVLDDGRRIRVVPVTVILVEGREISVKELAPGRRVVIRKGEMVAGAPAAATTVVTVPAETVTVQAPASKVTVQIPRQTLIVEQAPPQVVVQQPPPEIVTRAAPAPQIMMQPSTGAAKAPGSTPQTRPAPEASALPRETVKPPASAQALAPGGGAQPPPAGQPIAPAQGAMPPGSQRKDTAQAQGQSQVTPQQGQAQGETTTTIRAPQSRVTVQVPRSRIVVEQQPPAIIIQQPAPEIVVQPAPPPQVQIVPLTDAPAAAPRSETPPAPVVAAEPTPPPAAVVVPAPKVVVEEPWCEGAYRPALGTNFGSCPRR